MKTFTPFLFIIVLCLTAPDILLSQDFIENMVDDNAHGSACLYACDLDGDGDNDVLGALIEENSIVMWRNDGGDPISWTEQVVGSYFYSAHSVYATDIDGDQDNDIVGAAYSGEIAWWRNNGGDPIAWTKQVITVGFDEAHEVFAEDVDGDGHIDVLGAASASNVFAWWRNDGSDPINWTQHVIDDNSNTPKSVCAADLDGDQDIDVAGASILDDKVTWWRNDGGDPITWTEFVVNDRFYGAHRVQAVDIDGDGDIDLLGAAYFENEIAWWRNDGGDPINWWEQQIGAGMTRACIAFATDLDGDSDMDVLGTAQNRNQLAWWRNDGGDPIIWTKYVIDNDFYRVWPLYACDLDGDQKPDVMAGSSYNGTNEVKWWKNNLDPSGIRTDPDVSLPTAFSLSQNYPNPFNPRTTISFNLSKPVKVELSVFDIKGRLIRILSNEKIWETGFHKISWDGTDNLGRRVCSGIYIYRIRTENSCESRKMVLLK
jgi:hypothetical protein